MTETKKVLGQSIPVMQILTDAYTVPPATQTVISSIVVCNESANPDYFRISIAVAGVADATKQYIYYDTYIDSNDTFIATIGVTLGAADVVRVYSRNGYLSFSMFGVEVV